MAIAVHLVERASFDKKNEIHDAVHAVMIAIDDAVDTTPALILTRARTLMNANGYQLPLGYFDTERLVGIGTGPWDAAGDFTFIAGPNTTEVIA